MLGFDFATQPGVQGADQQLLGRVRAGRRRHRRRRTRAGRRRRPLPRRRPAFAGRGRAPPDACSDRPGRCRRGRRARAGSAGRVGGGGCPARCRMRRGQRWLRPRRRGLLWSSGGLGGGGNRAAVCVAEQREGDGRRRRSRPRGPAPRVRAGTATRSTRRRAACPRWRPLASACGSRWQRWCAGGRPTRRLRRRGHRLEDDVTDLHAGPPPGSGTGSPVNPNASKTCWGISGSSRCTTTGIVPRDGRGGRRRA